MTCTKMIMMRINDGDGDDACMLTTMMMKMMMMMMIMMVMMLIHQPTGAQGPKTNSAGALTTDPFLESAEPLS